MQHLTLQSSPLIQMSDRRDARPSLVYDDKQTALLRGPFLARLSPLEYVLVMALLRQRERWQTDPGHGALCLSVKQLCAISGSESTQSVHRLLNGASHKVAGLGIRIIRLHAEHRYFVLFSSEVEANDAEEEDLLVVLSS
ncbi:MAG TPA: hypothetical protein VKT82_24650 [Ktedonobacterales bacterium]|nr:hypothetical protein [Ktedonobacterales bacterium]